MKSKHCSSKHALSILSPRLHQAPGFFAPGVGSSSFWPDFEDEVVIFSLSSSFWPDFEDEEVIFSLSSSFRPDFEDEGCLCCRTISCSSTGSGRNGGRKT